MNNNDRRVLKTKHAIRDAFTRLLVQKPLKSITITEIANEADIHRRTFYLHYNCATDIIAAIEKEDGDKLRLVFENADDFDVERFFLHFTHLLRENFDYYSCIIKNPEYSRFELRCKDILKDTIKTTFFTRAGLRESEFDVYSEYVASGIMGVYTNWVRSESPISLEELTIYAREAVEVGWRKITLTNCEMSRKSRSGQVQQ